MESFHIVAFTRPQEGHEGGFVLTFNATVSLGFAKNNSCGKFIIKSVHALFVFVFFFIHSTFLVPSIMCFIKILHSLNFLVLQTFNSRPTDM